MEPLVRLPCLTQPPPKSHRIATTQRHMTSKRRGKEGLCGKKERHCQSALSEQKPAAYLLFGLPSAHIQRRIKKVLQVTKPPHDLEYQHGCKELPAAYCLREASDPFPCTAESATLVATPARATLEAMHWPRVVWGTSGTERTGVARSASGGHIPQSGIMCLMQIDGADGSSSAIWSVGSRKGLLCNGNQFDLFCSGVVQQCRP